MNKKYIHHRREAKVARTEPKKKIEVTVSVHKVVAVALEVVSSSNLPQGTQVTSMWTSDAFSVT